jgi:hypothetical protein
MARILHAFGAIVFILGSLAAKGQDSASGNELYTKLEGIVQAKQISRIVIIHVPAHLESPVGFNETLLREHATSELSIRPPLISGIADALMKAAAELKESRNAERQEVRWGILIFNTKGREDIAIFMNSIGTYIEIGGVKLQARGNIRAWIKASLREVLD